MTKTRPDPTPADTDAGLPAAPPHPEIVVPVAHPTSAEIRQEVHISPVTGQPAITERVAVSTEADPAANLPTADLPAVARVAANGAVTTAAGAPTPDVERRTCRARARILHDGVEYEPGAPILLTALQYRELHAAGAIHDYGVDDD